ncbi:hypothetical protein LCGC14_2642600, partial [marine sediment metagenome]
IKRPGRGILNNAIHINQGVMGIYFLTYTIEKSM